MPKITNEKVTTALIVERQRRAQEGEYPLPKWVMFCEELLNRGYELTLYEARETFSKYITVRDANNRTHPTFKVRFSNHKPIYQREIAKDCDFFVGVTHTGVRDWRDALNAVTSHFNRKH